MQYNYKAMNAGGAITTGTLEAHNEDDVITALKGRNLIPIEIKEEGYQPESVRIFKSKVKKKELSIFCRQFFTMLNAGVGIVKCLEIISRQAENKTLQEVCSEMMEHVQKGNTLSQSMKQHPDVFPPLLIQMIVSGEASGNMDSVMERMALHFEREYKIENKIKGAMIYPIILSVVAVAVVILILVKVMPTFVEMFEGSGTELPGTTKFVMAVSDFLIHRWYILIAIIAGIIFGIKTWKASESGRVFMDNLKLQMPVVKKQYRMIITSRFTRTLSTLLSSGLGLLEAIEIVSKVVGNYVVEIRLKNASEQIRKGVSLSKSIDDVQIFPPMVVSMISIGEESGAIDDILGKTADYYDEELETALQKLVGLLEPVMIIFMAIVIGFIVISIVEPMFGIYETIQ